LARRRSTAWRNCGLAHQHRHAGQRIAVLTEKLIEANHSSRSNSTWCGSA